MGEKEVSYPVSVNVYNLLQGGSAVSQALSVAQTGVFHSGVVVGNDEFAYGSLNEGEDAKSTRSGMYKMAAPRKFPPGCMEGRSGTRRWPWARCHASPPSSEEDC